MERAGRDETLSIPAAFLLNRATLHTTEAIPPRVLRGPLTRRRGEAVKSNWKWDDFPDVMGVNEIAIICDCSLAHARKLCETEKIKAVKPGNKWRAAKENVQKYMRGDVDGAETSDAA